MNGVYAGVIGLAVAASLSGCSTVTQERVLTNLQGCERHYNGVVSAGMTGGSFSGSVKIDCPHAEAPMPPIDGPAP